jgi:lysozyme family protein
VVIVGSWDITYKNILMANYDLFFPKLQKHEGGFALVKGDRGLKTYQGITEKNFPNWDGWPVINAMLAKGLIKNGVKVPSLDGSVKAFYKANFWDKVKADSIQSQPVAELYVDWFINSGKIAHTKVKEALKELGATGINKANSTQLHKLLIDKRVKFFNNIVKSNPTQIKFLKGWLSRVNSFAKDIPQSATIGVGAIVFLIGGFFLLNRKYKFIKLGK